jgi:acetyl esterase/lipase
MRTVLLLAIALFTISNNGISQKVIPLYNDSIPGAFITAYLPPKELATGTGIIIIPGGAYSFLATSTEGTPIAEAFVSKGVAAFVVKYRLPKEAGMADRSTIPMMDGQQAIKLVRMHAKEWNLDSNKIGIIGYSAGGHLASTLGTHFTTPFTPNKENLNLRPDFMILVYPVISMDNSLTHRGSRNNLLGRDATEEKVTFFSNEKQVTPKTPPTYLTHTEDDAIVSVENSIVFYRALLQNNVPAEMHLYPYGNHGFVQKWPTEDWLNPMLAWLRKGGFLK